MCLQYLLDANSKQTAVLKLFFWADLLYDSDLDMSLSCHSRAKSTVCVSLS